MSSPAAAHNAWCPRTPGFWKNEKHWPDRVSSRSPVIDNLAGRSVATQADVIEILETSPKGDKTIIMAHHVLATKLNLIADSDRECILETLDDANQWLMDAGFWANYEAGGVSGTTWTDGGFDGEPLKDRLDDYNNGRLEPECGCSEGDG